jgi:hypothetical protein
MAIAACNRTEQRKLKLDCKTNFNVNSKLYFHFHNGMIIPSIYCIAQENLYMDHHKLTSFAIIPSHGETVSREPNQFSIFPHVCPALC